MKHMPRARTLVLALAATAAMVSLAICAHCSTPAGSGLMHYFARLGIELNGRAILIALGLIPVFWLVGLVIKTFSAK